MTLKIIWSPLVLKELAERVTYLEEKWTIKEIKNLENKIENLISQIAQFPNSRSLSRVNSNYHKGIVDKNNILIYSVNAEKGFIEIAYFRNTIKKPKH